MNIETEHKATGVLDGLEYAQEFPRQRTLTQRQQNEYEEYLEGWQEGYNAMQIALESSFWNQF